MINLLTTIEIYSRKPSRLYSPRTAMLSIGTNQDHFHRGRAPLQRGMKLPQTQPMTLRCRPGRYRTPEKILAQRPATPRSRWTRPGVGLGGCLWAGRELAHVCARLSSGYFARARPDAGWREELQSLAAADPGGDQSLHQPRGCERIEFGPARLKRASVEHRRAHHTAMKVPPAEDRSRRRSREPGINRRRTGPLTSRDLNSILETTWIGWSRSILDGCDSISLASSDRVPTKKQTRLEFADTQAVRRCSPRSAGSAPRRVASQNLRLRAGTSFESPEGHRALTVFGFE